MRAALITAVVFAADGRERCPAGQRLYRVQLFSAFVLRTFDPPIDSLVGLSVRGVSRVGKRLVIGFDNELFLVIHLMIAGRLRWREPGKKPVRVGVQVRARAPRETARAA